MKEAGEKDRKRKREVCGGWKKEEKEIEKGRIERERRRGVLGIEEKLR